MKEVNYLRKIFSTSVQANVKIAHAKYPAILVVHFTLFYFKYAALANFRILNES